MNVDQAFSVLDMIAGPRGETTDPFSERELEAARVIGTAYLTRTMTAEQEKRFSQLETLLAPKKKRGIA